MASVLTIILNWNCAKDTVEAVDSIMDAEMGEHRADIFLVDNGSKDDSVECLQNYFKAKQYNVIMVKSPEEKFEKGSKRIFFYLSEKNLGFTGGNNLGFKFALANNYDFVFLLNADAKLRTKDALKILLERISADEKIACVGPKVYFADYHGRKDVVSFRGGYVNLWRGEAGPIFWEEKEEEREVGYIEGSAMLISAKALREAGLFDERFFAYWEDTDWCTRAKKKGYRVVYVPEATCTHKASMGVHDFNFYSQKKINYLFRNRLLFIQKHATPLQKFSCALYTLYMPFAQLFLRTIRRRNFKYFVENVSAIYMAFRDYLRLRG